MLAAKRHAEEIERLLARLHRGEEAEQARNRLVELTYGDLSHKVLHKLAHERRLRRQHEAEDIVHHVMERMKKVLEGRRVETADELVRLANQNVRWTIIDLARGLRDQEVTGLDGIDREGDADAEALEEWAELHHEAAFLPGRAGEVFRLRYYDRLPVGEIAGRLGRSVRSVQDDWKEALDMLSLRLTDRPFRGGAPKHLGGERPAGGEAS